ncbi:histidine kinase [Flavobacterium suaedae]|uniref:histidine kinase n=1 Tax=Flavobacterium suaedae TaxID=1767027 RepID=A0ABQ1JXR3_9FLAO|nr:ATP-binding protein [Flavobacterium suaedae]GGB81406.1 histidine kinase [Flavobacterium suaedae]
MEFKDIVNRDIVNLENCEQEPIHIPGSIQPHGFLLGLNETTLTVDFCSENSKDYINLAHSEILGENFQELFGESVKNQLIDYINDGFMLSSKLMELNLAGKNFLCTVHKSEGVIILEAELKDPFPQETSQLYDQTSQFLNYMHDTHTLKELCQLVAKGTRQITGYDRVMIYRFDKDYNGEVYAEDCREDLEPFLGLHYPHTDIPAQARQLYKKNLLRLITDVDYTPVPIYAKDSSNDNKNLDLSLSILRSTSPIHVQYLHNMGVGATLTISLIHKKELWGLIACHHYSPKNLSPETRLAAQLQGHFITSQIDLRQSNEEYEIDRKTKQALNAVNRFSLESPDSFKDLVKCDDILKLCNASGVSIVFNGAVHKCGLTPSDDQVQNIANYFATYTNNSSFSTNKLIDVFPEYGDNCKETSGVIYHSLNVDNNDCIIWYRPETRMEVNWAGDPAKSIIKDKKGLSPRNSFELWKEVVKCTAKPWLEPELMSAAAYSYSLQKHINLLLISQEEEKYRKLSELLKETNSELENINWISTHDLQEPLRKIQLISSRLLIKEEENIPESVQTAIVKMSASANRMQTLLTDILKYTRVKNADGSFEDVDLNTVMESVKEELEETISESNAEVIVNKLPEIQGIPFLLKQLFSNLIANSIKYSSVERAPEIKITASSKPQHHKPSDPTLYHVIQIEDNGIGFEEQFAESIFNIFTRLHSNSEYKGSGVGLALCKKIMQNHKGYIEAVGKPNEGASVLIYFPIN